VDREPFRSLTAIDQGDRGLGGEIYDSGKGSNTERISGNFSSNLC